MILRGSYHVDVFIEMLDRTIRGRDTGAVVDPAYLTREYLDATGDHVIYLGAGYWRAQPVWDGADQMLGVRLINPDRTPDEIAAVERGLAILRHLDYRL